ncbi:MAG: LCP family protein [Clostridiales bacterium]|nr:LCP family protein [Clostridiales bacterium]
MKVKERICLLLTVILCFASGMVALGDTEYKDLNPISILLPDEIPENLEGQKHILLLCVDQWNGKPENLGNTDGMLLLTLDGRSGRAMLTSFSRDMLVLRPDGKPGRITYITKNSGPEALCQVISQHFGIQVDQYILFDMKQVENIIQALGGVEITITGDEADYLKRYPINTDATTPQISGAGTYLFDGHSAVIYIRIRKVGGQGEMGRTERMRRVLGTLADRCRSITMAEATALLGTISENTMVTNLSLIEMLGWVDLAMQVKDGELEGIQMPVEGAYEGVTYAGMSVKQVDFEMCRRELHDFLDGGFLVLD